MLELLAGANQVLEERVFPLIPTGFRNKAQGCEERATLGNRSKGQNPNRVSASKTMCAACRNPVGVVGLGSSYLPRVARSSQPWASGCNPFGIGSFSKSDLRPL